MWEAWQRAGSPPAGWISPAVSAVALAHALLDDDAAFQLWRARAVEVAGATEADRHRHLTFAAFVDARAAVHTGNLIEAPAIVARAFHDLPQGWYQTYALAAAAELAIVAGLPDAKDLLAAATPAAEENAWAAACLTRATGRLHTDPNALTTSIQAWHQIDAQLERTYTQQLLDSLG